MKTNTVMIKDQPVILDNELIAKLGENPEFLGFSLDSFGEPVAVFKLTEARLSGLAANRPPNTKITFKDGNRYNLASDNLATTPLKSESSRKRKYMKGVYFYPKNQMRKWKAIISINGKKKSLGYFSTEQEAHEAYLATAKTVGRAL